MTGNAISELYQHIGDEIKVSDEFKEQLEKAECELEEKIIDIIGNDNFIKIQFLLINQNAEFQHYGFVTGFKYAIQLMLACAGN